MNLDHNKIAQQCGLTREVFMVHHSKDELAYKVQVKITQNGRSEMAYYFAPEAFGPAKAQELALYTATLKFMQIDDADFKAETTNPVQGEQHVEESKQEAASEKSTGEESGKKSRKTSKKSSEEKVVQESPQAQEEMIEVESPYKDIPAEKVEASVESPKKGKAAKVTAEPYNREDAGSKASFAVYATKLHNGSKEWKKREDLKEISTKLHGVPFIEKDGSIHPDFEAKCKELFGLDEAAL